MNPVCNLPFRLFIPALMVLTVTLFAADDLPLKRIVLFTSGVGYFQRDGEVDGNAAVELSFKPDQINDLLKSMVLQDLGGGRIAPVNYGSRDPVTRTLKSFAVDITDNPAFGELLNRLRGAKVIVAAPKEMQGMIVGVEKQRQKVRDEVIETEALTVLTDDGLRSVPLNQVQQVKLLDSSLDAELRKALQLLAVSHDTQHKPVTLAFTGQGKRAVRVGYILETPVWKTSYRLALEDKKPTLLQGWAIVENTTDDDWKGVSLALVSGRPVSFAMDLYQPLYLKRPMEQLEVFEGLKPQVYEGSVENAGRIMAERELGYERAAPRKSLMSARAPAMAMSAPPLPGPAGDAADQVGLSGRGVSAMAESGKVGELFQYAIDQPVTIGRQQSAMIPIVNAPIETEKVSIYNENAQRKFPLNGLRLKNNSGLHLMQGPITIFDAGVYAGDAKIADLQPKEERLLSYAMDLAVEVEPLQKENATEVVSIRINKGVMFISNRCLSEKVYTIKNKANQRRLVLVEHPFRSDWKLVAPEKPVERTPAIYRFRVEVEPGKSQKLDVKEEQQLRDQVTLVDADAGGILIYVRSKTISPAVKAALEKVVGMKGRLSDVGREREQTELQVKEISSEQTRIRDNMKVLTQQSELYGRYVKKFDQQETQIETLRVQVKKLRDDERRLRKEMQDYLMGLQVE